MNEFLSMGGYGGYVWPAYLISALLLGGLTFLLLRRAERARRKLSALLAKQEENAAEPVNETD